MILFSNTDPPLSTNHIERDLTRASRYSRNFVCFFGHFRAIVRRRQMPSTKSCCQLSPLSYVGAKSPPSRICKASNLFVDTFEEDFWVSYKLSCDNLESIKRFHSSSSHTMPSIRGLRQADNGVESTDTTSSCSDCSTSTTQQLCPQEISILCQGEEFRRYLEYHAINYQGVHPHITIQLVEIPSSSSSDVLTASSATFWHDQSAYAWDGTVFPAHLVGAMAESQRLADLTLYVRHQESGAENGGIDWPSILPFSRHRQSTYDHRILTIPLDNDVLLLYYRRDLFQQHNITVPRTWDEYQTVAAYFHNQPWGGRNNANQPLVGSCVSRLPDCANTFWTSLILSSMTQSMGTSSGYLLNPETGDPLMGQAMEETLRLLGEQMNVEGPSEEKWQADCMAVKLEQMNQGLCAMTYGFSNHLEFIAGTGSFPIGVAPTPGSTKMLNRATGKLEDCTPETCPYGVYHDDIVGIVNQPSYSAFGGWVGGVSNSTSLSKQRAVADFLSYMSNQNQSLPDVLPNQISSFADPYRYSHVTSSHWLNLTNNSGNDVTALEYTDAIRQINSGNAVLEIRIPPGLLVQEILDEEVSGYLSQLQQDLESSQISEMRRNVTEVINTRIQQAVAAVPDMNVTDVYQKSLGYSSVAVEMNMNYIDPEIRAAGWGLAGLICLLSLLLISWTICNKRNRIMRAFQPFLLIQCAIGLFFLGVTIVPLGFDDSMFGVKFLDVKCMATPWIYLFGFSLFYSSVYSKIKMCVKIFKDPDNNNVMVVRHMESLKFLLRVCLLNGVLLALWTALDPLKWVRQEVSSDETVSNRTVETFGACRGEGTASLGFAIALFFLNLIFCFVGTLQAFKCRFLVLEYNEIQWLPLALLPFFETWIIGGPLLLFMNQKPTTIFILLTLIIAVSSLTAALAVFAPKDWYIRKNKGVEEKNASEPSSRSRVTGVQVLNHPTVR
jgi:multiple sugar transport system substrate-binding protein